MEHKPIEKWRQLTQAGLTRFIRFKKPIAEVLVVRKALKKEGIRWWEVVRFYNPYFTGKHQTENGGYQWLDFVIRIVGVGVGVILFPASYRGSGAHNYQKRALSQKLQYLDERRIPYLIVPRHWTNQEYQIQISMWSKRIRRLYGGSKETKGLD